MEDRPVGSPKLSRARALIDGVLGPFADFGLGLVFIFGPEIAALCSALGISRIPKEDRTAV